MALFQKTHTPSSSLLDYLNAAPKEAGVSLDAGLLRAIAGLQSLEAGSETSSPELLPADFSWSQPGAERPLVPLPLCEFLAYKSALIYRIDGNSKEPAVELKEYLFIDTSSDELTDTQAMLFVCEGKAFIVFRGSQEDQDWALNFNDSPTDHIFNSDLNGGKNEVYLERLAEKYGDLTSFIGGPNLTRHLGMAISWAAARSKILSWLDKIVQVHGRCPVVLAGHSLGGALANLAALELASKHGYEVAAVVTFGAPAAGGRSFVEAYNQQNLGARTIRIEAQGDLVPDVMGRWYYKPLHKVRHWAKGASIWSEAPTYSGVGHLWEFDAVPPVRMDTLKGWIKMQREAMAKREARRNSNASMGSNANSLQSSPSRDARTSHAGEIETVDDPKNKSLAWIGIGFIATAIAALFLWIVASNKRSSHSVEARYAIYLSTLSYQQIRSQSGGDLSGANGALDHYIAFIRGNHMLPDEVEALPLRVLENNFDTYEQVVELTAKLEDYYNSDEAPLIRSNLEPRIIF